MTNTISITSGSTFYDYFLNPVIGAFRKLCKRPQDENGLSGVLQSTQQSHKASSLSLRNRVVEPQASPSGVSIPFGVSRIERLQTCCAKHNRWIGKYAPNLSWKYEEFQKAIANPLNYDCGIVLSLESDWRELVRKIAMSAPLEFSRLDISDFELCEIDRANLFTDILPYVGDNFKTLFKQYGITSNNLCFKVCEAYLNQTGDLDSLSSIIEDLGISDENCRFELAKLALAKRHTNIDTKIASYELTENHRLEIGELIKKRTREIVFKNSLNIPFNAACEISQEAFEVVMTPISGLFPISEESIKVFFESRGKTYLYFLYEKLLDRRHQMSQSNLRTNFEILSHMEKDLIRGEALKMISSEDIDGLAQLLAEEPPNGMLFSIVQKKLRDAGTFKQWLHKAVTMNRPEIIFQENVSEFKAHVCATIGPEPVHPRPELVITVAAINRALSLGALNSESLKSLLVDHPPILCHKLIAKLASPQNRMPESHKMLRLTYLLDIEKWFAAILSVKDFTDKEIQVLITLVEAIIEPREQWEVRQLLSDLKLMLLDPEKLIAWILAVQDEPSYRILPSFCFFKICPNSEKMEPWLTKIREKKKIFRDGRKERILTTFLLQISNSTLDTETKFQLFQALFHEDEDPHQRCIILGDLFTLYPEIATKVMHEPLNLLRKSRQEAFFQEFCLGNYGVTIDEADQLIASWADRDPNALITYLRKIKSLPSRAQQSLLPCYSQWISDLVKGNYPRCRYENSPHLQQLRGLGDFDALIDEWGAQKESVQIVVQNPVLNCSLGSCLKRALERYIVRNQCIAREKIPVLHAYLNREKTHEEAVLELQEAAGETVELQKLALRACREVAIGADIEALKIAANQLANQDEEFSEFVSHIESFIRKQKNLASQSPSRTLLITDTDDAQDLFLLGSETGGCQSIYGEPEFNKCALAYVIDGKNRAIVLKDPETKKIVARAIIRLVWDGNEPALFVEPLYSTYENPELDRIIDQYAIQLGEKLHIHVYCRDENTSAQANTKTLSVFGLAAPFEYSDAADGIQDRPYKIQGLLLTTI